ncbi:MAG: P-II family nitrogen regulator [Bacilli bacterium]|nr:P-II family nitrogen regulator [Bacilli bacterium]
MAEKEVKKEKYEVVVVIVNEGHSDKVMDAAREAGARGGTIAHARGSGTKDIEKKYGIVITPSKEMLYILVNENIRDNVMAAINKAAGLDTMGQGIIFSLPVDNVSGLKLD